MNKKNPPNPKKKTSLFPFNKCNSHINTTSQQACKLSWRQLKKEKKIKKINPHWSLQHELKTHLHLLQQINTDF